uniref:Uncharacterized protein n=1 Tax=Siphoviridae sp. ctKNZ79 TaxID=2825440 RepID=A0A8S5U9J3_9CAUD|nr:MAG TPA: hypothetical protein [Siphoviridae sp. ctKNZ79]
MGQGDITPKGTGKGRKWAQIAQRKTNKGRKWAQITHTQGQDRADRTNRHGTTSKMAQLPHTKHRRGRYQVKNGAVDPNPRRG